MFLYGRTQVEDALQMFIHERTQLEKKCLMIFFSIGAFNHKMNASKVFTYRRSKPKSECPLVSKYEKIQPMNENQPIKILKIFVLFQCKAYWWWLMNKFIMSSKK